MLIFLYLILEVGCALGVQLVPEIEDDVVEDGGVDVLGQLHENEPVPIVTLPQHGGDVVAVHGLNPVAEEQVANVLARHRHHPAVFMGIKLPTSSETPITLEFKLMRNGSLAMQSYGSFAMQSN